MTWYERILVPLDGSQVAEVALDRALDLVRQFNSKLVLVQVIPLAEAALMPPGSNDPVGLVDVAVQNEVRRGEAASQQAEDYLGMLRNRLAGEGIAATVEIEAGEAAERILYCAQNVSASLIVMSTHGHGGLKRRTMGGTASAVVQQSAIPVLIIPYR